MDRRRKFYQVEKAIPQDQYLSSTQKTYVSKQHKGKKFQFSRHRQPQNRANESDEHWRAHIPKFIFEHATVPKDLATPNGIATGPASKKHQTDSSSV
jgi:hypothetical protein